MELLLVDSFTPMGAHTRGRADGGGRWRGVVCTAGDPALEAVNFWKTSRTRTTRAQAGHAHLWIILCAGTSIPRLGNLSHTRTHRMPAYLSCSPQSCAHLVARLLDGRFAGDLLLLLHCSNVYICVLQAFKREQRVDARNVPKRNATPSVGQCFPPSSYLPRLLCATTQGRRAHHAHTSCVLCSLAPSACRTRFFGVAVTRGGWSLVVI